MRPAIERMRLVVTDITTLDVDAIVTSANEALCGGHGVDGAVHRAAGPGLIEDCRKLGICNPGEAKITGGHRLPARFIIHTVGPVWEGGEYGEADTLRACYRASLAIAADRAFDTIAFPCIATGVYDYPRDQAGAIAVETVREWLASHAQPREVIFCCYEVEDAEHYRERLSALGAEV
jgi:O-acetyl-ADP-ribose deacetylase (regulator of RNase III)